MVVSYKAGTTFAGWQSLFAGGHRRVPRAHLEGSRPRRGDEERVLVVGWPVDRELGEGRQRHAHSEPPVLGRPAPPRQGRLQVRERHRSRVPGVPLESAAGDLPAAADRRGQRDQGRDREREPADERAHGVRRGAVDQQRAPAVHRHRGAAGVRLRHRPGRGREAAVRRARRRPAVQLDQLVRDQGLLRPERVREVPPRSGHGLEAHDRSRLEQGQQGCLGQGRQGGCVHAHHDGRRQAQAAHRADRRGGVEELRGST